MMWKKNREITEEDQIILRKFHFFFLSSKFFAWLQKFT